MEILRADRPNERERWLQVWSSWPAREVFAHPAYVELFTRHSDVAAAAIGHVAEFSILYPFVVRPLSEEAFWDPSCGECVDLVGPYGYGGAYWWGEGDRPASAAAFWDLFDAWATRSRVVSEFVRFDLDLARLAPYPGSVEVRSMNVIRSLDAPPEMWMDMAPKVRKNVKRARENGLRVVLDPSGARLEEFHRIYWGTMSRRSVDPGQRFSLDWFVRLVGELAGQFMFFHVLKGDEILASELVLVSTDRLYSFLGGTDRAALPDRPNDLLKHEVMLWGWAERKRDFVLGGGYETDDGIFRYKRSFAPKGVVPFSVGCRIFDPTAYATLCRGASIGRGDALPRTHFFPEYRA
jgi:Acetyltransferase (GNAT) domain